MLSEGKSDQIIMKNTIFPEFKWFPTNHKYKVCGSEVCPQCISDRGFDKLNYVQCNDFKQKPVQNPICPECLELPTNHTHSVCGRIVCYYYYQIRGLCEYDLKRKELQEGRRNTPSISQMFM